jgi:pseudoazurin
MRSIWIAGALVASLAAAQAAAAAEVVVEMLNRDKATNTTNVFKPAFVKVAKGDTVKWVATNPGHNVAFVAGGVPTGAALFSSGFDKEIKYKFDKPGIYVYKCTPHLGLGMVGIVWVGNDKSNLDAAKKAYVPPLAKKRLEPLFAEIAK